IADLTGGFGIIYISPLKALINDQHRRLESLGEALEMQVTPDMMLYWWMKGMILTVAGWP
ncbi:hypothetical protein ACSLPG_27000, partial [Escherichia coli]|uniref:hypothetical protein n=1 Tax=Escherichia coli TaxID=562 RepID=UPI003EE077A5